MGVWIPVRAFVRNISCVNYRFNNALNLIASHCANVIHESYESLRINFDDKLKSIPREKETTEFRLLKNTRG